MLPKVNKKYEISVRPWKSIALLSYIFKGSERVIARRFAWATFTNGILSPLYCGAFPERCATDLVIYT